MTGTPLTASALLGAATVLLLAACGGPAPNRSTIQDGAGAVYVRDDTPDAIPRHEPFSRYGNPDSYIVFGKRYFPRDSNTGYVERGTASWYGTKFHGKRTSSGEPYDMYAMTAAHKTLRLPAYVQVTNLDNGRTAVVRVNDRGPFHEGRIIDLSYAAARKLGITARGTGRVEVRLVEPGDSGPTAEPLLPEPAASDAREDGPVFLQVGAFSNREYAEQKRDRLALNSIGPVRIEPATLGSTRIYRVRLGPLDSSDQVDRMRERLEAMGEAELRVVRN